MRQKANTANAKMNEEVLLVLWIFVEKFTPINLEVNLNGDPSLL